MSKMYFCGTCKEGCDAEPMDMGNGSYEFWGMKGRDVNMCIISTCCEGTVFSDPGCMNEVDMDEYENNFDPKDD